MIAAQLIGVPIFLFGWGPELYGEWLLLTAIPSYLALSDLGLVQASSNQIVMQVAIGDRAAASRTLIASKWLVTLLASVVILVLSVAMILLPVRAWLGLDRIVHEHTVLIIGLLGIKVALLQRASLVASVSIAEGRNAAGIMALNYIRLAGFVSVFSLVALQLSPLIAAIGDFAATAISYAMSARLTAVRYSWSRGGKNAHWQFQDMAGLWGPAFGFLAYPFSQVLLTQGPILVVGAMLGPSAVTIYTTIRILTNSCLRLLEIVTISIWPEVSASFGRGDIPRTRHWNRIGSQWGFWGSLVMFGGLLLVGDWVHDIWVGGVLVWNPAFFVAMAGAAFLESVQSVAKVIPLSTNRHAGISRQIVFIALIYVALLVPIVGAWGLLGAAIALGVHNLALATVMLAEAKRLLELSLCTYLRDVTGTAAIAASLAYLYTRRKA